MTQTRADTWREGDVIGYTPAGGFMPYHCREGTAVYRDGRFLDTYWVGSDQHVLSAAELETARPQFNLNDFEIFNDGEDEWRGYADEDRGLITHQSGLQRDYYIRRGAKPVRSEQIKVAEERLAEAESRLRSAQWSVEIRQEALSALRSDPRPQGDEA